MSMILRVVLVIVAVLSCAFVLRKIRKAQVRIEDTLFWLVVSVGVLILGIFPEIAYFLSDILLFKVFILTVQISQLQEKLKVLAQNVAMYESELTKKKEKDIKDNV